MDRAELYELWQNNKHRPAFVLEHREAINEHTDTSEPVPNKGAFAIREWMKQYASVVTRQLSPDDADAEGDN